MTTKKLSEYPNTSTLDSNTKLVAIGGFPPQNVNVPWSVIESAIDESGGAATKTSQIITAGSTLQLTGETNELFHITLDQPTCDLSVNITVPANELRILTLLLKQGSGANKVTWDSNIIWQSGRPPILSYDLNVVDVVRLISDPAVSGRWYGVFDGAWFE